MDGSAVTGAATVVERASGSSGEYHHTDSLYCPWQSSSFMINCYIPILHGVLTVMLLTFQNNAQMHSGTEPKQKRYGLLRAERAKQKEGLGQVVCFHCCKPEPAGE